MTASGLSYTATAEKYAGGLTVAAYLRISKEDADRKQSAKAESDSIAGQRALLADFISRMPEFDGARVLEFCEM